MHNVNVYRLLQADKGSLVLPLCLHAVAAVWSCSCCTETGLDLNLFSRRQWRIPLCRWSLLGLLGKSKIDLWLLTQQHVGPWQRHFTWKRWKLGGHTGFYRCAPHLNPWTSSRRIFNIYHKALLSSAPRWWGRRLKTNVGPRATEELGLELLHWAWTWGWRHPAPASFCHSVNVSFLCDLCPLRRLWDSITPVCVVRMSGPPRVESMCLRLMSRGVTVTWLTVTLTTSTDLHGTGAGALCVMGEECEVPGYKV